MLYTHTIYYYKNGPQKLRTNTPVESKKELRSDPEVGRIVSTAKNVRISNALYNVKVSHGDIIKQSLGYKEAKELFFTLKRKNPASKYCIQKIKEHGSNTY